MAAVQRIYATGLCLDNTAFSNLTGFQRHNEVVAQRPAAGAAVARGARLTITVTPSGPSADIYTVTPPPGCPSPKNLPNG